MKTTNKMKTQIKKYTDCQTVEDFINWYSYPSKAGRSELRANLKMIGDCPQYEKSKNERKAIIALLA